jgi:hypothetical protein
MQGICNLSAVAEYCTLLAVRSPAVPHLQLQPIAPCILTSQLFSRFCCHVWCLQASGSKARVPSPGATVFLCALAADAGTLAPALQHYSSGVSACLAAPPGQLKARLVTTADIQRWRQLQQEGKEEEVVAELKGQLPAAALNIIVSPLDYGHGQQLPQQYVGVVYMGAEGDYESVKQRMDEAARMCNMCDGCLLLQQQHPEQQVRCETDCAECDVAAGTTCEQCAELFSSPHPLLRPCRTCQKEGRECLRIAVLVTGLDNDAKQLKYMKVLDARLEAMFQQVRVWRQCCVVSKQYRCRKGRLAWVVSRKLIVLVD